MPSSSTKAGHSSSWRLGVTSAAASDPGQRALEAAPLIAGGVMLLLLMTTLVIGWMVRQSTQELTRKLLESVLSTNVSALELWLSHRRSDVDRLAANDELMSHSQQLLSQFANRDELDATELESHLAAPQIASHLPATMLADAYLGWVVMDCRGRVVASSHRALIANQFVLPHDTQTRLDRGRSIVCKPVKAPVALSDSGPLSHPGAAVMFAMVPVSEGLQSLGSFALMLDPLGTFSKILTVSRIGATGETYAFDRQALLISRSRFENTLRRAGLLNTDPNFASPLNVALRDPGADLTTGDQISDNHHQLTVMADQATRGATGSNVTGYRSYLGTMVVGSWRWLPRYNLGVATEMAYAEAYSTMRILRKAFIGALLVVALAGLGVHSLLRLVRSTADVRISRRELKRRLGQYDLGKVIGRGGMGSVYHGRHHLLRRDVAIKVLEHTEATTRSLSRFEREVQMTAKLRHPNTIEIYDYGRTPEGTFFYVMEYVEGISLQQLVDHYGRQPAERVIYLLLQVCGSIAEAHRQSMVHRDIKPANVLLTANAGLYDLVKVLDFGLVKEIDRETIELTRTEVMTGTPLYMSPEVVRDASKASLRSDLYSIGAVGYTLLTGLPPFDGLSSADICAKQLNEEPIRPAQRIGQEISDDLQNIIMSCLRKDPSERPSSAEELADALAQCQDAGLWSIADACQWWESVFDGPRDDLDDLNDNSRSGDGVNSPDRSRRKVKPGHDTKVNDREDNANPTDQPSEKTAL